MNSMAQPAAPWPRCRPGYAVAGSIALLLGITFGRLAEDSLLWRELQNTGHTLLFGVLALLVLCSYRAYAKRCTRRGVADYLVAGVVCLTCGIAVELIQEVTGRDADAIDVLRDLAGILSALGLSAAFDPGLRARGQPLQRASRRLALLVPVGCLAIASISPFCVLAWAYQQRAHAFPVLADPAARWSAPFLALSHASLDRPGDSMACAANGKAGLARLRLEPVRYAGFSIIEPQPDWRGHTQLLLELYSIQPEPLELSIRIDDARHNQEQTDRYNRRLALAPGENTIHIPLSEVLHAPAERRMDMAHIAGVTLYITDTSRPVVFCMGPLRLE
ncbi:MAG: VanZ family protein [Pseudomonadota bacterium]